MICKCETGGESEREIPGCRCKLSLNWDQYTWHLYSRKYEITIIWKWKWMTAMLQEYYQLQVNERCRKSREQAIGHFRNLGQTSCRSRLYPLQAIGKEEMKCKKFPGVSYKANREKNRKWLKNTIKFCFTFFCCSFVFCFVFPDKVSLWCFGCPETHFVDQAGL